MRSYEFSAKSVDKAIKLGLETLNKKQEEVDIKIINEGGFFKKAKIVINIEDEPVRTNFKKAESKKEEPKQEQKQPEIKQLEVKQEKVKELEIKKEVIEQSVSKKTEEKTETIVVEQKTEDKVVEEIQEPIKTEQPQAEVKEEVRLKNNETSKEFISGLMNAMNLTANVELKETKDNSQITIEIEDAGAVIGYRGECLSSIQYLANVIEQKHNKNAKRVVVDAGDYKKRREQQLRDLAIKIAGKVEATGRPHKFEPMNAYERRIIHTELQNYSSVETHSEGEEPHRRLIITKKAK